MYRQRTSLIILAATAASVISSSAQATDLNYQNFFFAACPTATGTLAVRCAQTPGGLGDLSGDSESSLNPSQGLSSTLSSVGLARARNAERAAGASTAGATPDLGSPTSRVEIGPFSLLLQGRWQSYERDRNPAVDLERGIESDEWGLELGIDRRVTDRAVVGALVSYEAADADFAVEQPGVNFAPVGSAGSVKSRGYGLTLFANSSIGSGGYLEASAGYDRRTFDFTRNSVFQESRRIAPQTNVRTAGNADGDVWWLGASAGNDWARGAASYGLYGGLTYTVASVDSYTETDVSGSGLAMRFAKTERKSTLGYVGLRAQYAASRSTGVLLPYAKVEYLANLDRKAPKLVASLVLDPRATQLALRGDEPESGAVNLGVGLSSVRAGGLTWFVGADLLVGSDIDRRRFMLGLRKEL